jgi:hypothetical protein
MAPLAMSRRGGATSPGEGAFVSKHLDISLRSNTVLGLRALRPALILD